MWVKGFARAEAELGDEVTVETMTGRIVTGRLSAINPGYFHTFGKPAARAHRTWGATCARALAAYRAKAGE